MRTCRFAYCAAVLFSSLIYTLDPAYAADKFQIKAHPRLKEADRLFGTRNPGRPAPRHYGSYPLNPRPNPGDGLSHGYHVHNSYPYQPGASGRLERLASSLAYNADDFSRRLSQTRGVSGSLVRAAGELAEEAGELHRLVARNRYTGVRDAFDDVEKEAREVSRRLRQERNLPRQVYTDWREITLLIDDLDDGLRGISGSPHAGADCEHSYQAGGSVFSFPGGYHRHGSRR